MKGVRDQSAAQCRPALLETAPRGPCAAPPTMVQEKQEKNKDKGSKRSAGKSDKAAAKKAQKALDMEKLWGAGGEEEGEEGAAEEEGEDQQPPVSQERTCGVNWWDRLLSGHLWAAVHNGHLVV